MHAGTMLKKPNKVLTVSTVWTRETGIVQEYTIGKLGELHVSFKLHVRNCLHVC